MYAASVRVMFGVTPSGHVTAQLNTWCKDVLLTIEEMPDIAPGPEIVTSAEPAGNVIPDGVNEPLQTSVAGTVHEIVAAVPLGTTPFDQFSPSQRSLFFVPSQMPAAICARL
jgi:hypothetical protein